MHEVRYASTPGDSRQVIKGEEIQTGGWPSEIWSLSISAGKPQLQEAEIP